MGIIVFNIVAKRVAAIFYSRGGGVLEWVSRRGPFLYS
jgi:hypothetical protein